MFLPRLGEKAGVRVNPVSNSVPALSSLLVTALRHRVESSALSARDSKNRSARSKVILIRKPLIFRMVRTVACPLPHPWHGLCVESRDSKNRDSKELYDYSESKLSLPPTGMKQKHRADIIVETSVAAGVKRNYGFLGGPLNGLLEEIRKNDNLVRFEMRSDKTAAFAAGAD